MKKRLLFLALMLLPLLCHAQQDLAVAPVFSGKVVENMDRTFVAGRKIKSLGLESFESRKFETDQQTLEMISGLVLQDAKKSAETEIQQKGGIIQYALLTFQKGKDNAFLCVQSKPLQNGKYSVVMIYMWGRTSIEDLKKNFLAQ